MTYQVPFHLCTDFYKPGHILDYPIRKEFPEIT